MPAANYTPISLYYSTTAAAVPVNTNLVNGELAINITDGLLYYKDNAGVVQVIAGKGGAGVAGGSNTQVQYNNAGSLAGSANMTFNGTTLTVNSAAVSTGNLSLTGTSQLITAPFGGALTSTLFQTSTANSATIISAVPNGTNLNGGFRGYNAADPTNASWVGMATPGGTSATIYSSKNGTGAYLPMFFSVGGIAAAAVLDTTGNLLLGTTTSPSSGSGSMAIAGYGNYSYVGANGATVSTYNYGLLQQNSTVFNSTGAALSGMYGILSAPQFSHSAASGTTQIVIRGVSSQPQVVSSAATSILNMVGSDSTMRRTYAADTSSAAANTLYASQSSFGHEAGLSSSATTASAFGYYAFGRIYSGSTTNYGAFRSYLDMSPTSGSVSTTNLYGILQDATTIGASTGTATVTNYYGLYLTAPSVGGNGTVTNRYGVYQDDTAASNYFGGSVGIGLTTVPDALSLYNATAARLNIYGDAQTQLNIRRYSTDANAPAVGLGKYRGTYAAPAAVASGDTLTTINFQGYGGTNLRSLAFLAGAVNTYTSDTDISGYLRFGTSPSGSATAVERMRLDSSGNLLLGTLTSPASGSGSMNIAGYAPNSLIANGASTTVYTSGLQVQNSTTYPADGSSVVVLSGVTSFPQLANSGVGTTQTQVRGGTFAPQITSSGANANLKLFSTVVEAIRYSATDTSSNAGNNIQGVGVSYGHTSTLSTSAVTPGASGITVNGTLASGSITLMANILSSSAINPASGTVSVTERHGIYESAGTIGTGAGTATATNYYQLRLGGTTVGTNGTITNFYGAYIGSVGGTGTITNRWGIYQADPLGSNFLAAPTTISSGYTVATLPTGLPTGTRAYVTDATAPTFLGTLTGGGGVITPVFYNGTAWVAG